MIKINKEVLKNTQSCVNNFSNHVSEKLKLMGWVGLAAICECGFHGASSMFPRTQKSEDLVSGLFGSIDKEVFYER